MSVTATSVADPTKSATATVTVMPPVKVSVTPTGVVMNSGKTQPFKATVTGSTRNGVTWSAGQGTISSSGFFTAPTVSKTTTVSVTATSVADPKVSNSVSVTVNPPISVSSAPGNVNVPSAEVQQFTATVKNTGDTRVTWSSSIGHVAPSGLYTAPDVTTETQRCRDCDERCRQNQVIDVNRDGNPGCDAGHNDHRFERCASRE